MRRFTNPLYSRIVEGCNWNDSTFNNSSTIQKRLPKKCRAYLLIACSGMNGITENEILLNCRLSSGRNYASDLERLLNIKLSRHNEANPDGIGGHFRYFLTNREDTQKVIELIIRYDKELISNYYINQILDQYPSNVA